MIKIGYHCVFYLSMLNVKCQSLYWFVLHKTLKYKVNVSKCWIKCSLLLPFTNLVYWNDYEMIENLKLS